MSTIDSVSSVKNFYNNPETTGSLGNNKKTCPECGNQLNFKSTYNSYGDTFENSNSKKKNKAGMIALITGLTLLGSAVGLAFAHKSSLFEKLGDKWYQKAFKALEPAGEWCHKKCSWLKNNIWDKLFNGGKTSS